MSNILLAKPELPPGFIDVSVGEPHVVREALFKVFDILNWTLPSLEHSWEYPPPKGYKPLVALLEHLHQAPVVITNGAKQALGATFYALKKLGWNYAQEKSPHWALIPPLAEMHGIDMVHANGPCVEDKSPFLLISPNNPDGHCESSERLIELSRQYKEREIPFIHDAAYYTYSYLPRHFSLPLIGDVQIYSLSKMMGLSNLRIGYAVCPNKEFYKLITEYVEAMTVGVSLPSQLFAFELLNQMNGYPTKVEAFENIAFNALQQSKTIMKQVDSEILEVPSDVEKTYGMFGWFKTGPKFDPVKSKINFIDGALFGTDGHVRMNLAFDQEKMQEIVNRLNSVKE